MRSIRASFGALLGVLLCASTCLAGDALTVFVGATGGVGSVRIVDHGGGSLPVDAPGLDGIRLLPIDFVGRTQLQEFWHGRPRMRTDVPGASRLSLPDGHGSLYRYVRMADGVFGFLWVDASGNPHRVFEVASSSGIDPIVGRVAVAPHGDAILVATKLDAGGDLFEVELTTANVIERTHALPPLDFGDAALGLQLTWGAGVSSSGILRFERSQPGDAEFVPIATTPAWYENALVLSANGQHAAAIAGEGPERTRVFVFTSSGAARPASSAEMKLAGAGFLPESLGGPYLAVADDGMNCAWRARGSGSYRAELFVGTVPDSSSGPTVHITQDAWFEPYLDEVGVLTFLPSGGLLFGVAERGSSGGVGLDGFDLFRYSRELDPLAGGLLNLSRSSGQLVPPFLVQPKLVPTSVYWLPESQSCILHTASAPAPDEDVVGQLLRVPADGTGVQVLVGEAAEAELLEHSPSQLIVRVREDEGGNESEVRRMPATLSGSSSEISLPEEARVVRSVIGPTERMGLVTLDGAGQSLWFVDVASGQVRRHSARPLAYGPTMGFASDGSLAFSVHLVRPAVAPQAQVGGGAGHFTFPGEEDVFIVWTWGVPPRRVPHGGGPSFLLPGL